MGKGFQLKSVMDNLESFSLIRLTRYTSPFFATFVLVLLLISLIFVNHQLFAKDLNYQERCDQETSKEEINKSLIEQVCLKAAKQAEVEKKYQNASWFYLLAGKLDYLINEMPQHIEPESSTVIYANIGHALVLNNDFESAEQMYWSFLTLGGQIMVNTLPPEEYLASKKFFSSLGIEKGGEVITTLQLNIANRPFEEDYKLLNKLFSNKKKSIEKGHQRWVDSQEKFYKLIKKASELNKLAVKQSKLKKYQKALKNFQQSLSIRENILGKKHPETARLYNNMGAVYEETNKYPMAQKYLNKALEIYVKEKLSIDIAKTYIAIGATYQREGNFPKTLEYELKALNLLVKILGKKHLDIGTVHNNLGLTYRSLGKLQKSLEHQLAGLAISKKVSGEEHPSTIISYINVAEVYSDIGNFQEAVKLGLKAVAISEKKYGKDHSDTALAYSKIGETYRSAGRYQQALNYQKKSVAINEVIFGERSINVAHEYHELASVYNDLGDYSEALTYQQRSLTIYEKKLGKQHPETAANYNNLGIIYRKLGDYSQSLEYGLKALTILENKFRGQSSVDIANITLNIGETFHSMGNFPKALESQQSAVKYQEAILGKKHPDMVLFYLSLASAHSSMGYYSKALKYEEKSLDISIKAFGKQHPSTAQSYYSIGSTYRDLGEYSKALKYQKEALSIRKELFGENHPDTAASYNNLGQVYIDMGKYQKSLDSLQKAMSIREKIYDEQHPLLGASYNNIALAYSTMGNYQKALGFQRKAIAIGKKLGKDHIYTATSYNNMGLIFSAMGDHEKALGNNQKALSIAKKALDKQHPLLAKMYNNIGGNYDDLGKHKKAIKIYLKTIEIQETALEKNHPDIATSYSNIGGVYLDTGDYKKALKYSRDALSIDKEVLGEENPKTAASYNNVGSIYSAMGKHALALNYEEKALAILEKTLDKQHPDLATTYSNLSNTHGSLNNYPKAYKFGRKSFDNYMLYRDSTFSVLNSQQKKLYLKENSEKINNLLLSSSFYLQSLLKKRFYKQDEMIAVLKNTINDWLAYKGSLLENENLILRLAKTSNDPLIQQKYIKLLALKKDYGQLSKNFSKNKINVRDKELKLLLNQISKIEEYIIKKDYRYFYEKTNIDSKSIANSLKENDLYIDFAKTGFGYYYIFTIDNNENITFNSLDKAQSKKIDKNIESFKDDIDVIVNKQISANKLIKNSKRTLSELYKLIFTDQLLSAIADKTSLIISPDGALRLLPFEALFDKDKKGGGQYLIESKDIRYIASGKELVRLFRQNKDKTSNNNKAVLFANPDFGGEPSKVTKEIRSTVYTSKNTNDGKTLGILGLEPSFSSLAGTKTEADAIASVLTLEEVLHDYRGKDANEAHLLQVKQPKILHIATHGFFLKNIPNPMLKSGLVLAGANRSLKENKGDGIVTALDLSGLELQGTDLVVLSACETGKVDPNNTDGISGLTKAFIQAGAKDVVMSLWSVDDDKTASLMTAFYSESKKNNSQYAKALKKSKLGLLEKGLHPYYWAAFVLSGL